MIVNERVKELIGVYNENKLAHAFLFETNDLDLCYKDVIELIKVINCPNEFVENCEKCNLCYLIGNNSLPSLIVIDPSGQVIKKEQVLELRDRFSTKPIYSKYNCYIIREADKLNSSSANSILKFLEEPEDGIIGFFITNNASNVISTIRSRCQIVSCFYNESTNNYDDEVLDYVKIFLNSIYKNSDDLLYNKVEMVPLYKERKEWEIFFFNMFYYVRDVFHKTRTDVVLMLEEFDSIKFINVLSLIEEIIKMIRSNVNIDLVLDKFVIEMRKFYE